MRVFEDQIQGHSVDETQNGVELKRVFKVSEIPGNPDVICFNAIKAPGIPIRGEVHPSIPTIQVDTLSSVPLGSRQAEVTVSYKVLPFEDKEADETQEPQISVGSTVQEEQTNLDCFGEKIFVNHTRVKVVGPSISGQQTTIVKEKLPTQGGILGIQVPHTVISLSRKEEQNPLFKSQIFVGKVNSRAIFGDPKDFWLCTRIDGQSDDGGATYNVTYEFQRNPDTWKPIVVYTDPDTGKPIGGFNIKGTQGPLTFEEAGTLAETGIKRVCIYTSIDFHKLNVDFGQNNPGGNASIFIGSSGATKENKVT